MALRETAGAKKQRRFSRSPTIDRLSEPGVMNQLVVCRLMNWALSQRAIGATLGAFLISG